MATNRCPHSHAHTPPNRNSSAASDPWAYEETHNNRTCVIASHATSPGLGGAIICLKSIINKHTQRAHHSAASTRHHPKPEQPLQPPAQTQRNGLDTPWTLDNGQGKIVNMCTLPHSNLDTGTDIAGTPRQKAAPTPGEMTADDNTPPTLCPNIPSAADQPSHNSPK